jgi:hypothetical protein
LARAPTGALAVETVNRLRPTEPLVGHLVRVEPIEERHRVGLEEAMAESPEIFRYMAYPGF